MCRDEKLPTTYLCGDDCPANPGAWQLHGVFHKGLRRQRKRWEDGGANQQWNRENAEHEARRAAQSGSKRDEFMAEGARHVSQKDWRRAAKAFREAIALRPDKAEAYYNLGIVLANSGHHVEAAQRYFEAKEHYPDGSEDWARATARGFDMLEQTVCNHTTKPERWNDEGLKSLSARVVRAAPHDGVARVMRAAVLCGQCDSCEVGLRTSAELKEAATHYEAAAVGCGSPVGKAEFTRLAGWCRSQAEAM